MRTEDGPRKCGYDVVGDCWIVEAIRTGTSDYYPDALRQAMLRGHLVV